MEIHFFMDTELLPSDPETRRQILDFQAKNYRVIIYYKNEYYYSYMVDTTTLDDHGMYPVYESEIGKGPAGAFVLFFFDDGESCKVKIIFADYNVMEDSKVYSVLQTLPTSGGITTIESRCINGLVVVYDPDARDDVWVNTERYAAEDLDMIIGVTYGESKES